MSASGRLVAVLCLDGVVAFDVAAACQVFAPAAGAAAGHYDVRVCGARRTTAAAHGLTIGTSAGLEVLEAADLIVVAGTEPIDPPVSPRVRRALRAAAARGARVASICTGAFVLARCGLLDGRTATTHWRHAPALAARYPEVQVRPDVLYVDEGDVLTSAGLAAGLDLCLHLVRTDLGAEVANAAARETVVAPHRSGGQAQFIALPVPEPSPVGVGATRQWLLEHLEQDFSVDDMAAHALMSRRSFTRHFRVETGMSPAAWVMDQRLDRARRLLETTDASLDAIARRCGFAHAASLRARFTAGVGVAPTVYRATFGERRR
jgi:transcriptional regulator GlxA family with amidase domain